MRSPVDAGGPVPLAGGTVVVLSARLGPVLPAAALPALREAAAVYSDVLPSALAGVPSVPFPGVLPAPPPDELAAQAAEEPVVLLTLDPYGAAARALAGATVITVDPPPGSALLEAVATMDRLRSTGGCPWDAEQTHASLRPYLIEEAYELLDAIEHVDATPDADRAVDRCRDAGAGREALGVDAGREALREELGDVLLQVLFHARIAAEHPGAPFDVDGVARTLVDKLVNRHPHVFAGPEETEQMITVAAHEVRWEELKREEKARASALDGVAPGQPAAALAAKFVSRAVRAGLPADLLPLPPALPPDAPHAPDAVRDPGGRHGELLFAVAASARLDGHDPETELRAAALRFAHAVRTAETAARAAGLDPAALPPEAWRRYYPVRSPVGGGERS